MAGELVAQVGLADLIRESEVGEYTPIQMGILPVGKARGLRLPKITAGNQKGLGYWGLVTIPAALTVSTGLTFTFPVTDDGAFGGDPGKVVRLGITVKKIASGETLDLDTASGAEVTADITLESTSGNAHLASIAVANANLDSAGAGDAIMYRIRRVGTAAQDTVNGAVYLLPGHIKNT
jgi:hypothetical protein